MSIGVQGCDGWWFWGSPSVVSLTTISDTLANYMLLMNSESLKILFQVKICIHPSVCIKSMKLSQSDSVGRPVLGEFPQQ